jgi:hypothetical protein
MLNMGKLRKPRLEEDLPLDVVARALFIGYAIACYAYAGMTVQKTQRVFISGVGPWHWIT